MLDSKTKNLVTRLERGDIALISHVDLDAVAAESLAKKRPACVLNTEPSVSGRYPNRGPQILLDAGIPVIDQLGQDILDRVSEGDIVEVQEDTVLLEGGGVLAEGRLLSEDGLGKRLQAAGDNLNAQLASFLKNTLDFAVKEKSLILGDLPIPETREPIKGRHVLVVVRGNDYRQDLLALGAYIDEIDPVLIGVDGGADALLEFGYRPDIIIGDMDSVSDRALSSGAQLIVHAYTDGTAPGLERTRSLGLTDVALFPAPGTSEDIAMLLAHQAGAELIVAVGTHSNMIDFLEKGRKGMASTFLVRLKVGSILVDAKGVSRLYAGRLKPGYLLSLVAAGLVPILIVVAFSGTTQVFFHYLMTQISKLLRF